MTQIQRYLKGELSNWFMIATFLWSVFLFSGYVKEIQTPQQTTQTEYVSKYNTHNPLRSLFFAKAYTLLYAQKHPLSINGYDTHFLVVFNRLIKTAFDQITKQSLFFANDKLLVCHKTMPKSSDDEPAPPFLG